MNTDQTTMEALADKQAREWYLGWGDTPLREVFRRMAGDPELHKRSQRFFASKFFAEMLGVEEGET